MQLKIQNAAICLLAWLLMATAVRAQGYSYGAPDVAAPDSTEYLIGAAQSAMATAPAQAIAYANRAVEAAILHRNHLGEAKAYYALGDLQRRLNRGDRATESLLKCKAILTKPVVAYTQTNGNYGKAYGNEGYGASDPALLLRASILLAQVFEADNKLAAALAEAEFVLSVMPKSASKSTQNEALRMQGRLLSKSGNASGAVTRLEGLLRNEQKSQDAAGECETRLALGEHFQRNGALAEAKAQYEKAGAIATRFDLGDALLHAQGDLAALYQAEGDVQNELNARNTILSNSDKTNDANTNYLQNIAIGNAYLDADQLEKAGQYVASGMQNLAAVAPKTMPLLDANGAPLGGNFYSKQLQAGADAYRQIAEGYLKKSELEQSIAYFKKYSLLQDSVMAVHARELEEAIALSKNIGKNEQRIDLLERERAVTHQSLSLLEEDKALQGSQIFVRNLVIGILVGCLLLGIGVGIVLARNTRARRRADKLLALQSMSGQMNPHFIFNALNSVNEFISQNDERAANRYLTAFSKLMRKVMDDSRHTFIPLSDEIDMLRLYLELEHARFHHQFDYTFEVDETLQNAEFELPPMMVQPYIENAIWHGLRYRKGKGHLHVHFLQVDQQLEITICDDGIGVAQSKALKTNHQKKQNSMGMKNIGTRIALMNEIYQCGMSLQITAAQAHAENPGTKVKILIPTPKAMRHANSSQPPKL